MDEFPTVMYQGQTHRVLRKAHGGDNGFDNSPDAGDQVIIKFGDGSERVVPAEPVEGGGEGSGGDASTAPPVVVDVPYASQTGNTLNCTMGNWTEEPDSYAYQWQKDGTDVAGATAATYTVMPGDVGSSMDCEVTATNTFGSASSTSNAVVVE